ncbi:MAG: hypothetical protein JRH08_07680 [Deltaproteobacteria bacterium]|nr:hypothetical protein [Deltaproteobacteria bacterium]MBW1928112.1 hypothetical protein [Deltaproteobacteria bacterium]MBW2025693.1 hypothetical protein [Deltaproteobacteria bacterium]MBW2125566.1 hypothetical protein [Deltaproteobacteria bacterium]
MDSEQLVELLNQVEEKGISWEKLEEDLKISRELLNLYAQSGPVPPRIINNLKKFIDEN